MITRMYIFLQITGGIIYTITIGIRYRYTLQGIPISYTYGNILFIWWSIYIPLPAIMYGLSPSSKGKNLYIPQGCINFFPYWNIWGQGKSPYTPRCHRGVGKFRFPTPHLRGVYGDFPYPHILYGILFIWWSIGIYPFLLLCMG